ncbi:MAG: hypothetical protein B1H08_03290 [Candidatus Omnitrophica bacterium 4484_171]|nr:MAG: hypothetical protein B1H08_03290 [Candidatus Omnitrophica bacterium 4484_171]
MIQKEIISSFYPFNKLKNRQLNSLLKIAQISEYKKDDIIYSEGDKPDYFYFLVKGRVVAISIINAKPKKIELIRKGTSFGIISIFTGQPHSVTVKAIEKSRVVRIEKEKFKMLLKKIPFLAFDFSVVLSKRVKKRTNVPKRIFQSISTTVLILEDYKKSLLFVSRLAESLRSKAKKEVIVVEVSRTDDSLVRKYVHRNVLSIELLKEFKESLLSARHSIKGVDYLCLKCRGRFRDSFYSLANYLSESYHFIFYVIPAKEFPYRPGFLDLGSQIYVIGDLGNDLYFSRSLISSLRPLARHKDLKAVMLDQRNKSKSVMELLHKMSSFYIIPDESDKGYFSNIGRVYRGLSERTLGIALGSGGAYGASHIGVFKVFNKHNINLDMLCGSSIGSVIAGLWALGYSYKDMEYAVHALGKSISLLSFSGVSFPFRGILRSRKLESVFKSIFGNKTFDDAKIPLSVIAFDFKKREAVIIKEGFIYKAVSASCAMPGIFEPVSIEGNYLLDGGVLSPLPAKALLKSDIKRIIAVNVTPYREEIRSTYRRRKHPFNVFDFIFGSIETMQQEFIRDSLEVADIVIHPDLGDLRWTDFSIKEEFIKRGYKAALSKIDEIMKLAEF